MNDYRKVLIAVNGSKDILVQGLRLVSGEKCYITVVKVIPPYEGDLSLVRVKNIKDVLNGDAERAISEIKEVAKTEGASVKVRLEEGDISEKIVEVAKEESTDLIIMGTGRQNSIKNFLLGNLLEEVTPQAPCPVLVVNDKMVSHFSYFNLPRYCESRI